MQSLWQEIFRRERERETGRERRKRERKKQGGKKKRIIAVEFIFHSIFQNAVFFPTDQCLLTQIKHFPDALLG